MIYGKALCAYKNVRHQEGSVKELKSWVLNGNTGSHHTWGDTLIYFFQCLVGNLTLFTLNKGIWVLWADSIWFCFGHWHMRYIKIRIFPRYTVNTEDISLWEPASKIWFLPKGHQFHFLLRLKSLWEVQWILKEKHFGKYVYTSEIRNALNVNS